MQIYLTTLETNAIGQANVAIPTIAAFHQVNCSIVRAAMAMFTPEHLSRLTLVVLFLYDWLISVGAKITQIGSRHLVDRKDRRDFSLFQIGWRFIDRQLLRLLSFPLSLCTYL